MDLADFAKEHPSLPSDSEESDEDYAPSGADSSSEDGSHVQGPVSGDDTPSEAEDESQPTKGKRPRSKRPANAAKRRKKSAAGRGRRKREEPAQQQDEQEDEEGARGSAEVPEEELKKKADALWQDFKSTVPEASRPSSGQGQSNGTEQPAGPSTVTVTQVYQYAGEEVSVQKEVATDSAHARIAGRGRARGGGLKGLSAVLGQLGRKPKIGTLEKSKMDWDNFKRQEGIEEDVRTFNRGKDGFLERQDFLQRTDVRQFEIERALRTSRRSNR